MYTTLKLSLVLRTITFLVFELPDSKEQHHGGEMTDKKVNDLARSAMFDQINELEKGMRSYSPDEKELAKLRQDELRVAIDLVREKFSGS